MAKKKESNQIPENDQTTPAGKTGTSRGRSKTDKKAAPLEEASDEPKQARATRKTKAFESPAADTPAPFDAVASEGVPDPVVAAPKKRGG